MAKFPSVAGSALTNALTDSRRMAGKTAGRPGHSMPAIYHAALQLRPLMLSKDSLASGADNAPERARPRPSDRLLDRGAQSRPSMRCCNCAHASVACPRHNEPSVDHPQTVKRGQDVSSIPFSVGPSLCDPPRQGRRTRGSRVPYARTPPAKLARPILGLRSNVSRCVGPRRSTPVRAPTTPTASGHRPSGNVSGTAVRDR